jgi:hypothetical protein
MISIVKSSLNFVVNFFYGVYMQSKIFKLQQSYNTLIFWGILCFFCSLTSCSDSIYETEEVRCEVKIVGFNQGVANSFKGLKTTYINRGGAPITVDGFILKVENIDFPNIGIVEEDFYFNTDNSGLDEAVLKYVGEGLNRFTAESFGGTPHVGWKEIDKVDDSYGSEKAEAYGILLGTVYPEYVIFKDTVEKYIVPDQVNNLILNMKPVNGRLAIVLENNNRTHKVNMYVNGELKTISYLKNACYLLNDDSPNGTELVVKLDVIKGNKIVRTINRTDTLEVGKNKTIYINIP